MADEIPSVRQDLEAAFAEAESAAPPPPARPARSVSRETTGSSAAVRADRDTVATDGDTKRHEGESRPEEDQTEAAAESESERQVDRPRDQFGRFTSATPEARPSERGAQAQEPPEARQDEISDQPETEAREQGAPAILPPQSWSAAAKDAWHQLPRPIQEEVDRRERDVSRAFQQRAEQVNVLEPIAQAIQPYSQKLALRGINPAAAIQQLLAVQDMLESDPIQGVAYVARSYGVDLRNFATAFAQAQQPQDPAVKELSEHVARQEQMIRSWQQSAEQQEMTRITSEVQAFAANSREYPYFEHVRERMAQFMQSGAANTLAQAYRLACADNEDISRAIRQQQEQAQRSQRTQAEKQAADRARRAAVSVSGSPYGGGAVANGNAGKGTVRDDVYAAYEAVVNR